MNAFVITLALTFTLLALLNSYKVNRSLIWLRSLAKTYKDPSVDTEFILLFPVLREQKRVHAAIERLHTIRYPRDKWSAVFISTEKEQVIPGERTTSEIIESMKLPRHIRHLHYTGTEGVKADQLNWAIKQLEKSNHINNNTIIGVYDIDSEISADILKLTAAIVKKTSANVLQQPSLYFKNWLQIASLARSSALYQTVYGCYYEITSWRSWGKPLVPMRYCTGHGMFVRMEFLKKVGYFPSPLEDTRFGHICAYLNEPIYTIPLMDNCETTPKNWQRIKQASVWFSGDVQYLQALPKAREIKTIKKGLAVWLITNKTYRTGVWMLQGFLVIGTLIVGALVPSVLLVASVLLFSWLPALILLLKFNIIRKLTHKNIPLSGIVMAIILLPVAALLKSLGPWYALYRYIKARLTKTRFLYPKTESY